MKSLGKPLSIVLGLMAAAVLFHFLVSPFYENEIDVYAVWDEINWVMALGILIALALTYVRKRDVDPDADANTLIWVNVAFYAAVALAIPVLLELVRQSDRRRGRPEFHSRHLLGGS